MVFSMNVFKNKKRWKNKKTFKKRALNKKRKKRFLHLWFRRSTSNRLGVIMEIRLKILTLAYRVTRHCNRSWSIGCLCDFLLVIHSNHLVSEINGDFSRKSRIFPLAPVLLTPLLREFPLEFCNGGMTKKLVSCPYQMVECLTMCVFVAIQYHSVTYRQTDGFAITIPRFACMGMLDAR